MISKEYSYAIVGASRDPLKFGQKVFSDLLGAGYAVYPINPNADEILGHKSYPNLKSCLGDECEIDVAVFVVPPDITSSILKEAHALGIEKAWMQPGSESTEAIEYCKKIGMQYVVQDCIMLVN